MKVLKVILIGAALVFSLISCAQKNRQSATELLNDKSMRDSIMSTIVHDPQLMQNMMSYMMQSNQAMHMMVTNQNMMQGMMSMAGSDSTMSRNMTNMMMANPTNASNDDAVNAGKWDESEHDESKWNAR